MAVESVKHGMSGRSFKLGAVHPGILADEHYRGGYVKELFNYQPRLATADGYSAPTGATGNTNLMYARRFNAAYHVKGAGQTLLGPLVDSVNGGLNITQDDVAAEGVEYVIGAMNTARNPFAVTIGTTPNSFVRCKVRAQTVANVGELAVGWRKAEAFQANIDDYDEAAFLNAQAGVINRETILNNAATVTVAASVGGVASTFANGVDFTLEVQLIGREAKMFINGRRAAIGAAFNFDLAEVVVPFLFFLHGGGAGTCHWVELEVGQLQYVRKDPAKRALI